MHNAILVRRAFSVLRSRIAQKKKTEFSFLSSKLKLIFFQKMSVSKQQQQTIDQIASCFKLTRPDGQYESLSLMRDGECYNIRFLVASGEKYGIGFDLPGPVLSEEVASREIAKAITKLNLSHL